MKDAYYIHAKMQFLRVIGIIIVSSRLRRTKAERTLIGRIGASISGFIAEVLANAGRDWTLGLFRMHAQTIQLYVIILLEMRGQLQLQGDLTDGVDETLGASTRVLLINQRR